MPDEPRVPKGITTPPESTFCVQSVARDVQARPAVVLCVPRVIAKFAGEHLDNIRWVMLFQCESKITHPLCLIETPF